MRYFLMLLCMAGILSSCSTKFDINAPYQDVTIVYGLLNPADDTQYVRIEKGFLDASKSALELAKIPDSLYYGDILDVVLLATPGTDSIKLTRSINPFPKDTGTFASAPNILYLTTHAIDPTKRYQVKVTNKSSGKVITAQTSIVKDFRVVAPSADPALSPDLDLAAFNDDGSPRTYTVSFISAANAKIYSLSIRFHYIEWDNSNPLVKDTLFVDWPIFNDRTSLDSAGGENIQFSLVGRQFYSFLPTVLKKDPNKTRNIINKPMEFRFTAGGVALYDFVRVSQAQNGITQLQAQVKYTNIDGGLGIFSSRYFKNVANVGLNLAAKDTLACGYLTHDLNFAIPNTSCTH